MTKMTEEIAPIIVWAESEAEAQEFLSLFGSDAEFLVKAVYVAKRSGGRRDVGHQYLKGTYFPYDQEKQAVIDSPIEAPDFITSLVQWCSPDIIISTETEATISLEITYHILTYNNVAQRIPRMVRSASVGVPSVIFQKVDYKFDVGISWFVKTFAKSSAIFNTPCLAILFDDDEFTDARQILINFVNNLINRTNIETSISTIRERMQPHERRYEERSFLMGKNGKERKWVRVDEDAVTISIGVRDNCALTGIEGYGCQGNDVSKAAFRRSLKHRALGEKGCVWLSKGTGGMDPYPGLVKMAEILLCYNDKGERIKKLVSYFANLPEEFWWFKKNTEEIYYKLILSFSDEVRYTDTYK